MNDLSYILLSLTCLLLAFSNLWLWFSLFKLRKDFNKLLEILHGGFNHHV